jgi:hypothetical protein
MGVGNDGVFHSQHFIVFSDCFGFSCIQRHGLASLQLDGGGVNGGLLVALCLHDADKILGGYKRSLDVLQLECFGFAIHFPIVVSFYKK